jgi:hypothetical protein
VRFTSRLLKTVQTFSAYGIPEEQIAMAVGPRGISAKTLRKYFHRELAAGMMKANATATISWLKSRMKWNEKGCAQSAMPSEKEEESIAEFERRIADELARIAAARSAAKVPGENED